MGAVRRLLRTPELVILAFAVAIAVAASSAVGLFGDRVARALDDQSGEAFGHCKHSRTNYNQSVSDLRKT